MDWIKWELTNLLESFKEFYEAFWDHVKVPLLLFKMAFLKKELRTSQKQAVIKFIEKRTATKGL